jgi:hypothetical protein
MSKHQNKPKARKAAKVQQRRPTDPNKLARWIVDRTTQ